MPKEKLDVEIEEFPHYKIGYGSHKTLWLAKILGWRNNTEKLLKELLYGENGLLNSRSKNYKDSTLAFEILNKLLGTLVIKENGNEDGMPHGANHDVDR